MIILDGRIYQIDGKSYKAPASTFFSQFRGIDGTLSRTETGIYDNTYEMTLNCNGTDLVALRATFAKATRQWVDFVDAAGRYWNAGSTGGGELNTGVKFDGPLDYQWVTEAGENPHLTRFEGSGAEYQRYLVSVKLQVNSTIA